MDYVPKSYILAAIMKVKIKYFQDACVTDRELNVLTNAMQKRFNEANFNVIITEDINYTDFENIGLMYVINDRWRQTIYDIEKTYQAYLPLDILSMIWDEKFILKGLTRNLNSMVERLEENFNLNK